MKEPKAQRLCGDLEHRIAGRERIATIRLMGYRARFGARLDEAVVGLRIRPDAYPEHAGPVARHFEDVARRSRERRAGRRSAEALRRIETKKGAGIERHGARA